MTVQELIKKLNTFNPSLDVVLEDRDQTPESFGMRRMCVRVKLSLDTVANVVVITPN